MIQKPVMSDHNSSFQDLGGQKSLELLKRNTSNQSETFCQKPTQTSNDYSGMSNPKEEYIVEENEMLLSQHSFSQAELPQEEQINTSLPNLTSQTDKVLINFCDQSSKEGTNKVFIAHKIDQENETEEFERQESKKIYCTEDRQSTPKKAEYTPAVRLRQPQENNSELFLKQLNLLKEKSSQVEATEKNLQKQKETMHQKIFNETSSSKKFVLACQRKTFEQHERQRVIERRQKMTKQAFQEKQEKKLQVDNTSGQDVPRESDFQEFFSSCRYQEQKSQCPQGFKADMVCVEKGCTKSSYLCSKSNCSECSKAHQACNLKFTTEMLAKTLNKNLERQKQLAKEIYNFGQSVIQDVLQNRKILNKYLCFQGLEIKNFKQQASQDKQVELKSCQILSLLDSFKNEESHEMFKLQVLRKKINQNSASIRQTFEKGIDFLLRPMKIEEQLTNIPTRLVTNLSQLKFIIKSLDYPSDLTLLYRASEKEFNLKKYHRECDDVEHTLTIIKTQHDKLIGAYTPLKIKNNKMGRDRSNKTFLLAINLKQKLDHIRSGQCAVYYNKQTGPSFGGLFERRDIEVFEQHGQLHCITNFPNTFNWKKQFMPCQESWRFLTGVNQGQKCRVIDFEVFRVRFRE